MILDTRMNKKHIIFILGFVVSSFYLALASDPMALQDFCIADLTSSVKVNGFACKDPKDVTVDDFFYAGGLTKPENFAGVLGIGLDVAAIHGLNTLGISVGRQDFTPGGLNTLHLHPRATELVVVLEGTLEVGFVTSSPDNKLFSKVLKEGDVFVIPTGLLHFKYNVGNTNVAILVFLSSQNPGIVRPSNSLFESTPSISDEVLEKTFQIDSSTLGKIRANF